MKRAISAAAIILSFATVWAQQQPESWARFRVWANTQEEIQRVADCDLGLFSEAVGPETDLVVKYSQLDKLKSLGLYYQFVSLLPDPRNWAERYQTTQDYRSSYLQYAGILSQMEAWRAAYPKNLSRRLIGKSRENRDIWMYRLNGVQNSNGSMPRFSVVIFSGIHAREWITEPVGMYLVYNLLQRAKTDPTIKTLLNEVTVYYVPVLNPDGYAYTWSNDRYWRKNRRNNGGGSYGVDLNRNFSKGFGGGGSSGNSNSETYRGPSAFSEPENVALRDALANIPNLRGFIDIHSFSQLVLFPWGYTGTPPATASELNRVGNLMRQAIFANGGKTYLHGQCYNILYQASGISMDWAYDRGIPYSFSFELRDTGDFGFELPEDQIIPTQVEIYAAFERYLTELRAQP